MTSSTPLASTRRTTNDQGFTLVEILIVIVILGILSVVVVLSARGIADRGEKSSCDADARTLLTAADTYLAEHGVDEIPPTGDPSDLDSYEQTLVDAGYLREASTLHDLSSDATIAAGAATCP